MKKFIAALFCISILQTAVHAQQPTDSSYVSDAETRISVPCTSDDNISAYSSSDLKYVTVKGTFNYDYAAEELKLLNAERAKYGAEPLKLDKKLSYCAMARAAETAVSFSHTRPNGDRCFSILDDSYYYVGENIAAGYSTPAMVTNGWIGSSGHHANMINEEFKSVGIGCIYVPGSEYSYYWVQMFSSADADETTVSGSRAVTKYVEYAESNIGAQSGGLDYSAVFDAEFYANKYKDIKNAYANNGGDAFAHFLNHGMAEGRQGSEDFVLDCYKFNSPDLVKAFGSDNKKYYLHYVNYGKNEGRTANKRVYKRGGIDYSSVYDFDYYLDHNSDIKSVYGNNESAVFEHFLNYGIKEGRRASADFDYNIYRFNYADLAKAFGSDKAAYYRHYAKYGANEGRQAAQVLYQKGGLDYTLVYDHAYYLDRNSDIKKAFGDNELAAFKHFTEHGMAEGRCASADFNVRTYRSNYADLEKAFGDNYTGYFTHYMRYGYKEGRRG